MSALRRFLPGTSPLTSRLLPPLSAVIIAAVPLAAQQQPQQSAAGAPTRASTAAVRAAQAPAIDGRDDDAVWATAPVQSAFQEFQPTEGKDPRFRTEFRVAFDDRNLYVFVRAHDPHPDSIMTALTRRDTRGASDQLKVMIDAYHDRRSGFEFAVNPVGVKRDFAMYNDRDEDAAWDGVWDVATRIDSLGWTAEFRIPFSQLRYATKPEHTFGFGVWRDIERYAERTSWPLYRPSQGGISSQLGTLTGIRDIAPFRRLEIVPFGVARNESERVRPPVGTPAGTQLPPKWNRAQRVTAGLDLKYGVTPNITIDATVNPDFGQVEADPAVLNLSAFEQFFAERRPFFVEGAGLYSFSQNSTPVNRSNENLFYSRRIGRAPQLVNSYGDAWSATVTPILGAAKVTGRLPGGLNVGVLEALTGSEHGTERRTIEPRTSYSVVRAQQELRNGETSVGIIATGVNRSLDEWTRDVLRRDAYVFGGDLRHRWGASRYEVNAKFTGSVVRGSAAAIQATQVASAHYYQRPDDRLTVNPTRTSLGGDAQELSIAKMGGNMVRWLSSYERQSPGYEPNDLGYLRRANRQVWKTWTGLNFQRPTRVYRQMSFNFNYQGYWTAEGLPTDHWVNSNGGVNLANNNWLNYSIGLGGLGDSFCDECSRGGPAVRSSRNVSMNGGWEGDGRKRITPYVYAFGNRGDEGRSRSWGVDPGVNLRLRPNLQASLGLGISANDDDNQWFGNFSDGAGATHYTFARLDQETRSATVRLNYTATPTLSFQLYAQPYFTRGRFADVRELSATPRAADYEARYVPYTAPAGYTRDFNVKDLRSNSVVRWEFRPGSTLFAVWTHGRSGFESTFDDRPWRSEYSDVFALRPDNTFLIKMAYWINP